MTASPSSALALPLPRPSELLLFSPRPGTDGAFQELAARLQEPVAPVPVRVIRVDDAGQLALGAAPRPGAALVTGGQPQALQVLASGTDWRWVHLTASGPDHLQDWPPIPGRPLVTYARGVNARSMAEWVLASILYFYRDLDHYLDRARRPADPAGAPGPETPRWDRRWARELSGARLLVVGAGSAGAEAARLAGALGLTTVGVSRSGSPREPFHHMVPMAELESELAQADVTLVLLPLTEGTQGTQGNRGTQGTRGSFHAERIRRLKPGSLLLVASRGGIVDEHAVLDAVRGGRLRGAAFDVVAQEPLPDASPLWQEPRILVTPHVAGTTDRFMEHTARIVTRIWDAAFTRPHAETLAPYLYAAPGAAVPDAAAPGSAVPGAAAPGTDSGA